MGYDKNRRPILVRTPGSGSASATADSLRANTIRADYEHVLIIASASSVGTVIGPRGTFVISAASSAGAASPAIMYLATPTSGDFIRVSVNLCAATSNTISLRTQSSATVIGGAPTSEDSILFAFPTQGAQLLALSSARWLALTPFSTVATGSSMAPVLTGSTS